jgi:PiT family inorganic phosphate transporter
MADTPILIILILLALIFDLLNGLHDSANIVATVISSRALHPQTSLLLTALGEFTGPFLFGVAVAKTVGADLLETDIVSIPVMIAALIGAIGWNLLTWYIGLPSSSSHALIGGLLGAAIAAGGFTVIKVPGLIKILLALFISPPLGLLAGFLLTRIVFFITRNASPRINNLFRLAQIPTSIGLALSHGANDAQKTMGVITLALLSTGRLSDFMVPTWVVLLSAAAIALGTSFGGWRLIRTLGGRIFTIRPVHGFSAQLAGAGVILVAALLGGPVSTTQVMSSSIMGAGAAERLKMVRWQIGKQMLIAWFLTIPMVTIFSALLYFLLR